MAKLWMGVVGLGMGRGHAQGYLEHDDVDAVVLCDVDESRPRSVGDELGGERALRIPPGHVSEGRAGWCQYSSAERPARVVRKADGDDGATHILEASWAVNLPGDDSMITSLSGAKGGLVHRYEDGRYEAEIFTEEDGALFTKRLDQRKTPTPSSFAEFVDSIVQGRPPSATGEQGLKVVKILEGIYRSARSGREVRYKSGH
jgi:predicted dehydrogenase